MAKFDWRKRNFETRVQFIHDLFADLHDQTSVMANCAKYKLSKSFDAYCEELEKNSWTLEQEDPMKVLKRIERDCR